MLETPEGALFESNVICRYLAAQAPGKLYPAGLSPKDIQYAQIEQWVDWCNTFDSIAAGTSASISPTFY